MSKIYLIDDGYVKNNFPSINDINSIDLLKIVLLEQESSLKDAISYETYINLLNKVKNNEINGEWVEFLRLCQKHLLLNTVKSVHDFYFKDDDEDKRDHNVSNLYGKIKSSEKDIKKFLSLSTEISTGAEYSGDYYNGSPIYYPN